MENVEAGRLRRCIVFCGCCGRCGTTGPGPNRKGTGVAPDASHGGAVCKGYSGADWLTALSAPKTWRRDMAALGERRASTTRGRAGGSASRERETAPPASKLGRDATGGARKKGPPSPRTAARSLVHGRRGRHEARVEALVQPEADGRRAGLHGGRVLVRLGVRLGPGVQLVDAAWGTPIKPRGISWCWKAHLLLATWSAGARGRP